MASTALNIRLIEYGSAEHMQMIDLRNEILRKPLGLIFNIEDATGEKNDFLIGAYAHDLICGCCVLSVMNNYILKLRQMAVAQSQQNNGIGAMLLQFAESIALTNHYSKITMHARAEAVGFYKKSGYKVIGNSFLEVSIKHFMMEKDIG